MHPVVRRVLAIAAATVAVWAAGFILFFLTASAVAAALRALAYLLLGLAVVTAVGWLLSRVGICCPGLHCPGCPHGR
jgi:energy-converting hydrogenase Eha subunit G